MSLVEELQRMRENARDYYKLASSGSYERIHYGGRLASLEDVLQLITGTATGKPEEERL